MEGARLHQQGRARPLMVLAISQRRRFGRRASTIRRHYAQSRQAVDRLLAFLARAPRRVRAT